MLGAVGKFSHLIVHKDFSDLTDTGRGNQVYDSEPFMLQVAVCNLASLALNMYVTPEHTYDFEKLAEVTKVIVRNLNKIIDINFYPIPEVWINVPAYWLLLNPRWRICHGLQVLIEMNVLGML